MFLNQLGCSDSTDETLSEFNLVYFDYLDGKHFNKAILIDDSNIEENLVMEWVKKSNLPDDMYTQIGFNKLKLKSVKYDKDSKSIDLVFNDRLMDLQDNTSVLLSLTSCISRTLENLESVEFIYYYIDDEFIEGIGEVSISGELIKSEDN